MASENKVVFNIRNFHYAPLTVVEGVPSWGDPVHVPGTVSLVLNAESSVEPFYADGIAYYRSVANNGYAGDLEMARFPDQMLVDIWKFIQDETDKVLMESAFNNPQEFAALFQIDGDTDNEYYCLYNVTGTKPAVGASTSTESKTPQTRTSSISAAPLENGLVMARTTAQTSKDVKDGWFQNVYYKEPAA